MLALTSGLLAGTTHVLTGPDHLAALAPVATRQPGAGFRLGIIWGVGHGIGVLALALLGAFLGASYDLDALSHYTETIVGLSLIALGIWSLFRAKGMAIHAHPHQHHHHHVHDDQHTHLHVHDSLENHHHRHAHKGHSHATLAIGFLHGIAGAGHLFGALPALALAGLQSFIYLAAYLVSAILSMGIFGLFIGRFLRGRAHSSLKPAVLIASIITISIGLFWTANSMGVLGDSFHVHSH